MIDQKFLTSLKNKPNSAYNTTGFAKFQRLRILHNLLLALLNQEIKKIMSHGVECETTNQKTRVRNFTKKKENRTALHRWRAKKKGLHSNLVRFFAQNQVKSKKEKKRSLLKIIPIFRPNVGASLKETHKTYPLCDQTLFPICKRGGHASILHTIQCTYTILATQRGGMAQWPP